MCNCWIRTRIYVKAPSRRRFRGVEEGYQLIAHHTKQVVELASCEHLLTVREFYQRPSGKIFRISIGKEAQAEGEWWHLELGEPEDRTVLQYFNLFSDPTARGVIAVRKLTPDEKALVEELAGWKGITPSPTDTIKEVLHHLPEPDSLAVYDVGQGSCNALLSGGFPTPTLTSAEQRSETGVASRRIFENSALLVVRR